MADVLEQFKCNRCGENHDEHFDALKCCSSVSDVLVCSECGTEFSEDQRKDADACCETEEKESDQ